MKIDKKFIEEHLGYEVQNLKVEPVYEGEECVGMQIFVTPKKSLKFVEIDFKVLPTGTKFEDYE
jgi:hypothetical protein